MALDLRQSRSGYYDRCKYYKGVYVSNRQLVQDAIAQGVFYSDEKEPFKEEQRPNGSILIKEFSGVIETPDNVDDLETNDYVVYGGDLYRVEEITRAENKSAAHAVKKPNLTTIKLRR